jgi:F420-0:gamma-glutamyl ligase
MQVTAIKTRRFLPPKDSLEDLLSYFDATLSDGDVVAISSKVLSICEGACKPTIDTEKQVLIANQSDEILSIKQDGEALLTRNHDMLLEYGGVDTLKAGYYVTLPNNPYKSALAIWKILKKRNKIKKLGVIITDSHSVPYRRGAIGMAIAGYGFKPVTMDGTITKTHKKVAMIDTLDSLAATANVVMGEGSESTPLAIIRAAPNIEFFTKTLPASIMRSYMYVRSGEVYNLKP